MSSPIIDVKNLSVAFGSGEGLVTAVESVSFSLNKGKTVALVGESGSGKSVSALSIMKLLPYPKAHHPSGEILYQGQDLLQADEEKLRAIRGDKISMIFQEPMTSLNPLHTIEKQICETLWLHKQMAGQSARERCLELLNLVGIKDAESRLSHYPHQLSGGQRQRVMIAMALANEPDVLLADEPTTALDVTVQKQILELLQDLQHTLDMAILLITHDLNIVRHYADDVCVMLKGKQVEYGPVEKIFSHPEHSYTQTLLSAEPSGQPKAVAPESPVILKTEQLDVRFPSGKNFFGKTTAYFEAVKRASLELRSGETLGVVGESGSGKTTLAMAVLKLLNSSGKIELNGQRIDLFNQKQMKPLRQQLQVVFQDPFGSLSPRMSVGECIAEGLVTHNIGSSDDREHMVCKVLEEVGMDPEVRHRFPHEFSGGQRQRIAIARAVILEPEIIILDEPTSALDRTIQIQIIELLKSLQQKHQISYLFISHDLAVVRALSHKVMVIQHGDIIETGLTDQIFNEPQHPYTQSLLTAALN